MSDSNGLPDPQEQRRKKRQQDKSPAKAKANAQLPKYRRCPECYDRTYGIGRSIRTDGFKRYYKCNVCDHNWDYEFSVEEVPVTDDNYRECLICHSGYGGIGESDGRYGMYTRYKCNMCGHRWSLSLSEAGLPVVRHKVDKAE